MPARPKVPATSARSFKPTDFVAQVVGYVIEGGKRVDKFTLVSPTFYGSEALAAWLEDVPARVHEAVANAPSTGRST